jgi:hypothetical protein
MTIVEAGIIASACVGMVIGGTVGGSHGVLTTVGFGTGGLVAGAAGGWLFAVLLICLLSIIGVLWRAARKHPADPPSEPEMKTMSRVAVRGTFVSAMVAAFALAVSSWLGALLVLVVAALTTAFLAVARSELPRAE